MIDRRQEKEEAKAAYKNAKRNYEALVKLRTEGRVSKEELERAYDEALRLCDVFLALGGQL